MSDDMMIGFTEASRRSAFFSVCSEHITRARSKHPMFANLVSDSTMPNLDARYREYAEMYRARYDAEANRGEISVETVLLEEVYELLEALAAGKKGNACSEVADVIAVCYRIVVDHMGVDPFELASAYRHWVMLEEKTK